MMVTSEFLANAVTTVSIVLAGRNSVHTWWTGIIGCLLFSVVFYQAQLYADVALQFFFLATSLLGWWQWSRGAHGQVLPVTRGGKRLFAWAALCGGLATGMYGTLLHRYTNAYAPFWDSAILVFSIIAQIYLMQRRIETWLLWLLVNTLAVPLYASRELHLTAFLYAGYWVNALVSWRLWRRLEAIPAKT